MNRSWHEMTALDLGRGIAAGAIDPVELAEHFLARIAEHDGDHLIYLRTTPERARAEAAAARARAKAGLRRGPLDGVPLSWKDLYDAAGVPTTGGSPLIDRLPVRDATVLARASRAGMVCLGKTNMPEFAYSGLGQNPHFGTPPNPFDPETLRAPGGSSAGAAVSVVRGLAPAAIGSDTGGSVRIPSAWNGLVGLKTTVGVLPTDGVVPLGPTFDTVGPLTKDVADANAIFAVLAAGRPADLAGASLKGATLLAPSNVMWQEVEAPIAACCESALERLAAAGARVVRRAVPELDELGQLVRRYGNLISAEGSAIWGELIEAHPDQVDASILARFHEARNLSAAGEETLRLGLADISARYLARTAGVSAVVAPTVPVAPPPLARLASEPEFIARQYGLAVRNTRIGNQLGICALALPAGLAEGLPAGLMLMAPPRGEHALLRLGGAAEAAIAQT